MQKFWYKRLLLHSGEAGSLIQQGEHGGGSEGKESDQRWKKLQGLMMQLRKVGSVHLCMHPGVLVERVQAFAHLSGKTNCVAYMHACMLPYKSSHAHEHTDRVHACIHTYIHTYIHTHDEQVCNHPFMFPGSEPEGAETDQNIILASAKMQV